MAPADGLAFFASRARIPATHTTTEWFAAAVAHAQAQRCATSIHAMAAGGSAGSRQPPGAARVVARPQIDQQPA
ncbi:hypothetical protein, partial [Xanthomonas translucens]|uniref:hypothetical protein n=1 Tax=Xanthomonas campestris pv. translucens TaxID=343 RepID=UPI001E303FD2